MRRLMAVVPGLFALAACTGQSGSAPATRPPDLESVSVTQTALFARQATQIAEFRTPRASQAADSLPGGVPQIASFDGVEMVLVPPGCFYMGSDGGQSDEIPAHRQCFDAPFYIDRYEVTNAQFARLGGHPGWRRRAASRWSA